MRLSILFLSSSLLFCVTSQQLSRFFQLVKPNREVVGSQPIRVETKHSIIQCLMELVTLYSYFIEIQETDSGKYICKMFRGSIVDYQTVSNSKSDIYGSTTKGKPLCQDHQGTSSKNGVYEISSSNQSLKVYCDMEQEGGGWTTIQRRVDGSVDFKRDWVDYKNGFGDPAVEYWLGLDNIHAITNTFANMMVRIEASTFDGERAVLIFEGFKVDTEENLYKLTCGKVIEDPKSLASSWQHGDGMPFTTRDRDNDQHSSNCANYQGGRGGQWYNTCARIYFNAEYPSFPGQIKTGIIRMRNWKDNLGMMSISLAIKVNK